MINLPNNTNPDLSMKGQSHLYNWVKVGTNKKIFNNIYYS